MIDQETGEIDPRAREVLDRFKGTYIEISPSGTGLRIFAKGFAIRTGKNVGPVKWLEVYDYTSPRYLTVTGHRLQESATTVTEQTDALTWLYRTYLKQPDPPKADKPPPKPNLSLDDAALLDKARHADNGHAFSALFDRGDTSVYGGDDSAADLALCHLPFCEVADCPIC